MLFLPYRLSHICFIDPRYCSTIPLQALRVVVARLLAGESGSTGGAASETDTAALAVGSDGAAAGSSSRGLSRGGSLDSGRDGLDGGNEGGAGSGTATATAGGSAAGEDGGAC